MRDSVVAGVAPRVRNTTAPDGAGPLIVRSKTRRRHPQVACLFSISIAIFLDLASFVATHGPPHRDGCIARVMSQMKPTTYR